jgi:trans-aconitate methyltransferase
MQMTQTWDTKDYNENGAFVHGLADGVLEWLAAKPGEHILDLGCGDGQLTQRIAATGAKVVGVDWSASMIAAARERGIEAVQANVEALPCGDALFDAVFSNAALHWVRDQDAMMAQVRRVLKPGGRFVAEMGGHGNIAAIRVALMAALERRGFGDREEGVNYYPTPESYTRRLKRHGFEVQKMALIPRPTPLAEKGMKGWLRTFRRGVLDTLPESIRETIVDETTRLLAPALSDEEGNWIADYVRLRFIATVEASIPTSVGEPHAAAHQYESDRENTTQP